MIVFRPSGQKCFRRIAASLMLFGLPQLACADPAATPSSTMQPQARAEAAGTLPASLSDYRLGAGDRVRLIVYGEPNLTGEFAIDGAGRVGVPLIGKVKAGGLTATALERRIADRLSPDYLKDPSVTVEIVNYRPFYIVGEVKSPGSYPYVNGMTAINAVALAGGFTYRAEEDEFRIDRGFEGKVREIEAGPGTEVLPGDVIVVPERFF